MTTLRRVYRDSLALLTDLYELTMACGYWRHGMARHEAVFHVTFRSCPFGGEFAVAAGLEYALDYLESLRFQAEDLDYLATLRGADGTALFDEAFLRYLEPLRFSGHVDGVPEGTVVFAHEPLLRITGPLLLAQLVETPMLTILNFQTLVATKAARVAMAAGGDQVLEFGLRRAQGVDGGISASRAAFIGGCHATSNVLAGKLFDIPVRGTHAHSWVMAFEDERASFQAYAEAMPHNTVLLVDTYDTLEGIRKAVQVAEEMRRRGQRLLGVRLDSGDLVALSRAARRMLDEAGFPEAAIVGSGDLDEYAIVQLKRAGAAIDVWGVGTKLATAYDQPALGGIYKLGAIRATREAAWSPRLKRSEQLAKASDPGILQVRRFGRDGEYLGDMIYDETLGCAEPAEAVQEHGERRVYEAAAYEDLLIPLVRDGRRLDSPPTTAALRNRAGEQLARMPRAVTRLEAPVRFDVGRERRLFERKNDMLEQARGPKP